METFTVSFFGHRQIDQLFSLEDEIEKIVSDLMREKKYVEFLVGRDGDFDQLVASTIRRCKRSVRDDNNALVWVMPYPLAEYLNNEQSFHNYYDEVEIFGGTANTHFKSAFQARNRSMADRSDLVIFCVERREGGAYQTMKYVEKRQIPFINLREGFNSYCAYVDTQI